MKINTYCSTSKQFKHLVDQHNSDVIDLFNKLGYSLSLRSFSGGRSYTTAEEEVGNPDMMLVYVGVSGNYVGKGCFCEVEYAVKSGIPVIFKSTGGLFIPNIHDGTPMLKKMPDENDYRYYARFDLKGITVGGLEEIISKTVDFTTVEKCEEEILLLS